MSSAEGEPIRVLHVDDDPDLGTVVALHLEREREEMTVLTEHSVADGMERIATDGVDCVVSDHDMPGKDGIDFLEAVRERYPDLPFVLFTGTGSEEVASEAISAGVTEYLQKGTGTDQYAVLANRIERAVASTRAETALEESERMLSTLISNVPGMVYRCRNEPGWPMTFVSDGVRDLTGYSPDAVEAGDVNWGLDVIDDADRDRVWAAVQAAFESGDPFEVTYRIETSDGDQRWVWERGRAVDADENTDVIEGFVTDVTARKERERELKREREFTNDVVNSLEDLFYVVTVDGEFIRWNDRVNEVTGYGDAEIAEMTALDFFPEEHHDTVVESTRAAIERGTAEFEVEIRTKDGEHIPYEFRGTTLYDSNGDLTGISGVGRDVSEREARERTLRRYETLVENVGDPMYVMDPDGTVAMVNEAMAAHVGYDREEMVGESPRLFVTDEAVDRANELIGALLNDDDRSWATFEMETISADGTRTYNEDKIAVLTDEDGAYQGTVGVIRDISERKARERELERHERIVQAVGDPVYTLDEDGVFTFVNGAMEALSGYDRAELIGEHISTVMVESDVQTGERLISDLLRRQDMSYETFEMDVVTSDGDRVPCENHVALLPLEDGQFRGTVGVIRDISERKAREHRLEEFASVVSHDLRNPLNVVQGRVRLALETGDIGNLEAAVDATERMERLIDDLLRLAQQGRDRGAVEPVDVGTIATDAWDHLVTDGATLTVDTARTVQADPARLRGLFENLFRNAIQHGASTDGATAVAIRVGDTDDGFFVEDDGVGIEPDRRETVFDRGHTTGENGTGFGLAIVERIATAHGWTVSVTGGTDGGARFEIAT